MNKLLVGLLGVLLVCLSFLAEPVVADDSAAVPTVLITGTSRGIGLEFTRQYAALGWRVLATCRRPHEANELQEIAAEYPNVTIDELDVLRHDMVDALAKKYKDQPIDVLLNVAGFFGDNLQIRGVIFRQPRLRLVGSICAYKCYWPAKNGRSIFPERRRQ
ncbi:MAG: SDR family NAD(P)-dependent oxidoreductase [Gammaproteobacteria bacterium]|nr:SDR family NAD(P)-dependent oxidoreductase [Gammaproteobacteria bacterium]